MNERLESPIGDQVESVVASTADTPDATGAKGWRNVFKVHPACAIFPASSPDELRVLGEDIKANGLRETIKYVRYHRRTEQYDTRRGKEGDTDLVLIDGRNRLDAMELVGGRVPTTVEEIESNIIHFEEVDAIEGDEEIVRYIISANILRRHLNGKDKDRLIADLIKLYPTKSNRQIAKQTGSSPTTVGNVRDRLEEAGDVSSLDTRTDTQGRQQPARKRSPAPKKPPVLDDVRDAAQPDWPLEAASERPKAALKPEEPTLCDENAPASEDVALAPNVDAASSIAPVESTLPPNPVRKQALWLWGRLLEFDGLLDKAPQEIMAALTPPIREEMRTLAPKVATWLGQFGALP